jgi:hypothetical protein
LFFRLYVFGFCFRFIQANDANLADLDNTVMSKHEASRRSSASGGTGGAGAVRRNTSDVRSLDGSNRVVGDALAEEERAAQRETTRVVNTWRNMDLGIMNVPFQLLFTPLLHDEDDFRAILRKIVFTASFGFVPPITAFGAFWISTMYSDANPALVAPRAVAAVSAFSLGLLVFLPVYIVARFTQRAPDWCVDWWIFGVASACVGIAVSSPVFATQMGACAVSVGAILCHSARLGWHLAYVIAAYFIGRFNVTFLAASDRGDSTAPGAWPLAAFGAVHTGTNAENIVNVVFGLLVVVLVDTAVYVRRL